MYPPTPHATTLTDAAGQSMAALGSAATSLAWAYLCRYLDILSILLIISYQSEHFLWMSKVKAYL